MMNSEGTSVADALALRNGSSGDGFGDGNGAWWIVILALLFGWGRNGNGGFGSGSDGGCGFGYGGFGGFGYPAYSPCCVPATQQGVTDAFNFNQLDNGLRGLERGLCDGFYSTSTSINGVLSALQDCCCKTQTSLLQGFNGVQSALCSSGYQTQAGFNSLSNQLASCCCDIERGQDDTKFAMAQGFNQLLVANDKNTDRIINFLNQTEMDKMRTELQSAQFQLSQLSQTDNIINRLMPVAKPAYLTCSPYASAFGIGAPTPAYGGCGCGCC